MEFCHDLLRLLDEELIGQLLVCLLERILCVADHLLFGALVHFEVIAHGVKRAPQVLERMIGQDRVKFTAHSVCAVNLDVLEPFQKRGEHRADGDPLPLDLAEDRGLALAVLGDDHLSVQACRLVLVWADARKEGDGKHGLILCAGGRLQEQLLLIQGKRRSVLPLVGEQDDGRHRVDPDQPAGQRILKDAVEQRSDVLCRFAEAGRIDPVDEILQDLRRDGAERQALELVLDVVFVAVKDALVSALHGRALFDALEVKQCKLVEVRGDDDALLGLARELLRKLRRKLGDKDPLAFCGTFRTGVDLYALDRSAFFVDAVVIPGIAQQGFSDFCL